MLLDVSEVIPALVTERIENRRSVSEKRLAVLILAVEHPSGITLVTFAAVIAEPLELGREFLLQEIVVGRSAARASGAVYPAPSTHPTTRE